MKFSVQDLKACLCHDGRKCSGCPVIICKYNIRAFQAFYVGIKKMLCSDTSGFVGPIFESSSVFQVYVLKRPHVDEFLKRMGELFECVLFTASLAKVRNNLLLKMKPSSSNKVNKTAS